MKLIDLTRIIEDGMSVYPGDSQVTLVESNLLERDGFSNHQLSINMHAGTHIDGPKHMLHSDMYIDTAPLESFIGQGVLLDVSGTEVIDYNESFETLIPEQSIVVLYTGHGRYAVEKCYYEKHPAITRSFAQLLIRKRIKMLCLDMPSPDYFPYEVHRILLEQGVYIAENLANVEQLLHLTSFQIIALPLRIMADSSIARIVACVHEKHSNTDSFDHD